jgi:hypothetical protein
MSAPAVVNICKINAADIQFSEPKRNKQGGVSVSFKYKSQNVQFRFPQFGFPGGCLVKENENKDGSITTSYTMSASLQGCDPYGQLPATGTDDVSKAYNFLREFQEAVIQAAVANSASWFGKKRGEESIRDSFNKFLSVSVDKTNDGWVPNGKYPPSLRFKLPVYDGKVSMDVIDANENDIVVQPSGLQETFAKGCQAKIVASGSIYVIGQGFGLTWKPSYVQVHQRKRQTARDMFKDDEDDGEAPVPVAGGAKAALGSDNEDEEEEDDEEEESAAPASAPAPAPAPVAPTPTPTIVEISESKPAAKGRRKVGSAAP